MPLYTFKCKLGHTADHLRPMGTVIISCSVCTGDAVRQTVNRVAITSPEVDTRGMFRRFQEAGSEFDHAATQIEANTGQPVETPSIWQAAKATAQAMNAAGENPFTKP